MAEHLIFFDDSCKLCTFWARFIGQRDRKGKFQLLPIDSAPGREATRALNLPGNPPRTLILMENGRTYTRSTAVLRVARHLSWPWPLLYILILIPRPIRDLAYRFIAKNRHLWSGKSGA